MRRLSNNAAEYANSQYPSLTYSVSIGVAEITSMESPGSFLQRVESALSTAIKENGGTVCFNLTRGVDRDLANNPKLRNDLRVIESRLVRKTSNKV